MRLLAVSIESMSGKLWVWVFYCFESIHRKVAFQRPLLAAPQGYLRRKRARARLVGEHPQMGTGGESRVVFRLDPEDGDPMLALRDNRGNIRVYVGLSTSGPNVALMDDAGNIRAKLGVGRQATADGVTPSLDFIDENGEVRLKIFQYDGNEPVMLFLNENGDTSVILREQEGSPALGLLDKSGTTRGVFQLGPGRCVFHGS